MTRFFNFATITIACLFLSLHAPGVPEAFANSGQQMKAGIARVNITPEQPLPMSGYSARKDPFKGVHDSLYLTAVVFSDGARKAALISADLIGFSHRFCRETKKRIEHATGIAPEYVLLSATHTHGGPVSKAYGDQVSPPVEAYMEEVREHILITVEKAAASLEPVRFGMGTGTCRMNINRRARYADGNVGLGRNPDGPCDHDVAVIRMDDPQGNPRALLVNWPCHGTTGGGKNYLITGDWPGAAARFAEKGLANGALVHMTAGASGDINPIYGPNEKMKDIEAIGMLLGEEILRVAEGIETGSSGNIQAMQKTLTAKGKKRLDSRAPNQPLEPGEDVEIQLSVLRIGDILFAGISGEVMTEIGMQIKQESPLKNTVVVTHCNGNSGYLCTDEAYPEGGYEIAVTRTMPGTEGLITRNLLGMIREII